MICLKKSIIILNNDILIKKMNKLLTMTNNLKKKIYHILSKCALKFWGANELPCY